MIEQRGLEDPDYVVRVNHCLNKENCYNNALHVHCNGYRCEHYKPKHAKNAKVQAKILARKS